MPVRSVWRTTGFAVAYFILFLLVYCYALRDTYLFSDDYGIFCGPGVESDRVGFSNFAIRIGRPLYGFLTSLSWMLADRAGIIPLRIVLVGLLSLFCLAVFRWLRHLGEPPIIAFAVGLCVGTLPVFSSGIGWIVVGLHAIPDLLGFLGGWLVFVAVERGERDWRRLVAGGALYLAALFIHPCAAQMFWVVPFAAILWKERLPPRLARTFFAVGAITPAIYCLGFRIVRVLAHLPPAKRVRLTFEPFAKLWWLVRYVIPFSLNLWKLPPDTAMALVVAGLATLGLYLEGKIRKLPALVALFAVAFAPCLVSREYNATTRTMAALLVMALLLLARGLIAIPRRFRAPAWVHAGTALALAAVGSAWAAYNTVHNVVSVRQREVDYITFNLKVGLGRSRAPIDTIVLHSSFPLDPDFYGEFRALSSTQPWASRGLLRFSLVELGLDPRKYHYVVKDDEDLAKPDRPTALYIDMAQFPYYD